jgi:hypothetical protein
MNDDSYPDLKTEFSLAGVDDKTLLEVPNPKDLVGKTFQSNTGQLKCRVEQLLGCGGMGYVYKVNNLNRERALKIISFAGCTDSTLLSRFNKEVLSTCKVDHINVVKILFHGVASDGRPFFLMPLLRGQTLGELRAARTRLPIEEALPIFLDICEGLAAAHRANVVHRDLKPSNIMILPGVTSDTEITGGSFVRKEQARLHKVVIVDFGIAKVTQTEGDGTMSNTTTGNVFGTPIYMSPEQCFGRTDVDHRSDIYALGCLMFETVAGYPPFKGRQHLETMQLHTSAERPPLPMLPGESSRVLELLNAVIQKAIKKEAGERYQSIEQMIDDLKEVQDALSEPIPVAKVKDIRSVVSLHLTHLSAAARKIFTKTVIISLLGAVIVGAIAWYILTYVVTPDPKGDVRGIGLRRSLSESAHNQAIFEEQELALKNKIEKLKQLLDADPIQRLEATRRLADFYRTSEKYDTALFQYELAHQLTKEIGVGTPIPFSFKDTLSINALNAISESIQLSPNLPAQELCKIYIGMADCLMHQNRAKEASNVCDYGIRILNKANAFYCPEAIDIRHRLARAYDETGAASYAEGQYRWCLANYGYDVDHPQKFVGTASLRNAAKKDEYALCLSDFGESLAKRDRIGLAKQVLSRAEELWEELGTPGAYNLAVTENELGLIATRERDPKTAEKYFKSAVDTFRKVGGADDLSAAKAEFNLADADLAAQDLFNYLKNRLNAKRIWKTKG